jgi:hypothetical protein
LDERKSICIHRRKNKENPLNNTAFIGDLERAFDDLAEKGENI